LFVYKYISTLYALFLYHGPCELLVLQKFIDGGFDHVYIHQVGPDQEGFFRFYQRHILPEFQ
jgi:hypothetical protein